MMHQHGGPVSSGRLPQYAQPQQQQQQQQQQQESNFPGFHGGNSMILDRRDNNNDSNNNNNNAEDETGVEEYPNEESAGEDEDEDDCSDYSSAMSPHSHSPSPIPELSPFPGPKETVSIRGGELSLPQAPMTNSFSIPQQQQQHQQHSDPRITAALQSLQEELDAIPASEKTAYLEAIEKVPHLVQEESDPIRFLDCENYHTGRAARRLVTFWEERKRIFGERAFCPLTLAPDGALAPDDAAIYREGYLFCLPPDQEGRLVVCYHPTRRTLPQDLESKMRILFYFFSIVVRDSSRIVRHPGVPEAPRSYGNANDIPATYTPCSGIGLVPTLKFHPTHLTSFHLLRHALPAKFHNFHFVCFKSSRDTSVESMAAIVLETFSQLTNNHMHVHMCSEREEIVRKLKRFGFLRERLATDLGGQWDYSNLDRAMEERARMENQNHGVLVAAKEEEEVQMKEAVDATENEDDEEMSTSERKLPPRKRVQEAEQVSAVSALKALGEFQDEASDPPSASHDFQHDHAKALGKLKEEVPEPPSSHDFQHGARATCGLDNRTFRDSAWGMPQREKEPVEEYGNNSMSTEMASNHVNMNTSDTQESHISTMPEQKGRTCEMPQNPVLAPDPLPFPNAASAAPSSTPTFVESEATQKMGLASFNEALSLIGDDEKKAYLFVLQNNPEVIDRDASPLSFLRFEKYNAWAAARRFVTYWDKRRIILGNERFFKPLGDFSGNGALTLEDVGFLRWGYVALLPRNSQGYRVIYCDGSVANAKTSPELNQRKLKAVFFVLNQIAFGANGQSSEFTALTYIPENYHPEGGLPLDMILMLVDLIGSGLPCAFKKLHAVCLHSGGSPKYLMTTLLAFVLKRIGTYLSSVAVAHVGDNKQDILDELQAFGMVPEDLPVQIGGNWTLEKWLDEAGLSIHYASTVVQQAKPAATCAAQLQRSQPSPQEPHQLNILPANLSAVSCNPTARIPAVDAPPVEQNLQRLQNQAQFEIQKMPQFQQQQLSQQRELEFQQQFQNTAQTTGGNGFQFQQEWQGAVQNFNPQSNHTGGFKMDQNFTCRRKNEQQQNINRAGGLGLTLQNQGMTQREGQDCGMKGIAPLTQDFLGLNRDFTQPNFSEVAVSLMEANNHNQISAQSGQDLFFQNMEALRNEAQAVQFQKLMMQQGEEQFQTQLQNARFNAINSVNQNGAQIQNMSTQLSVPHPINLPSPFIPQDMLQRLVGMQRGNAMLNEPRDNALLLLQNSVGSVEDQNVRSSTTPLSPSDLPGASFLSNPMVDFEQSLNLNSSGLNSEAFRADIGNMNSQSLKIPPTHQEMPKQAPAVQNTMGNLASLNNDRMIQQSLPLMLSALQRLPEKRKSAYLEAMRKAPQLVDAESDPVRFLRCENFDALAAAKRLLFYWEYRKKIFGENAFLPMVHTREGALNRDDIVILSAGSAVVLPNDKNGHGVLCLDRSKALEKSSCNSRLRCLFYLLSVMAEKEKNQTEGIILLVLLITPRVADFDHEFVQGMADLVLKVFPIKLKNHFVMNCPPKSGKKTLVQSIVSSYVELTSEVFGPKMQLHTDHSPEALLSILEGFELLESGLPPSLGGTWKYEEFAKWLRRRSTIERDIAPTEEAIVQQPDNDAVHKANQKLSDKERRDRKRKLNVIHSRQKRERRRAEQDELQEECNQLQEKKEGLEREQERLEELLSQAHEMVALIEAGRLINELPSDGASVHSTLSGSTATSNQSSDNPMRSFLREQSQRVYQQQFGTQHTIFARGLQKDGSTTNGMQLGNAVADSQLRALGLETQPTGQSAAANMPNGFAAMFGTFKLH